VTDVIRTADPMPKRGITVHMRACAIAERIKTDICARSGLQNEWDLIDTDTRAQIMDAWIDIATQEICRG
jgi:hypothetical protein